MPDELLRDSAIFPAGGGRPLSAFLTPVVGGDHLRRSIGVAPA